MLEAQKPPILFLAGCITEEAVAPLIEQLKECGGQPVLLVISSSGGDCDAGYELCDAIEEHGQVTGLVMSRCASMAVAVLCSCKMRIASAWCTFMVHSPTCTLTLRGIDVGKPEKYEELAGYAATVLVRYAEHLINRSGGSLDHMTLMHWCDRDGDYEFSPEQALGHCLVDRILSWHEIVAPELCQVLMGGP